MTRLSMLAEVCLAFSAIRYPSAKVLQVEPTANMFYNSGLKQGTLGLKTYYADFASNVFVYPILLFKGLPQLWFLLKTRMERP
mmetsp:Transcript_3856/g.6675  ORF Transcript_3856/g.6675 Transcript_3856/m.6675 type:complete len:83 (+) Transcript_3856:180-428(+)